MNETDVIVIGAGPAGLETARVLGEHLAVILVDENVRVGGQLTRQRFNAQPGLESTLPASVDLRLGWTALGWTPQGALIGRNADTVESLSAPVVVGALGAREYVEPLPGWLLPGAMTVGGAQTLLKGSGRVPFRRVVVDGTGPLPFAAAAQFAAAGVEVVALLGGLGGIAPLRVWPNLVRGGAALMQGARSSWHLARHRVPVHPRGRVLRVLGTDRVEGVEVELKPGGPRSELQCDAVLFSHGFSSANDLLVRRGAEVMLDVDGTTQLIRDDACQTTVPGLYAAGDCAGVLGGPTAVLEGRIVAEVILARHGIATDARALVRLRRKVASLGAFQSAVKQISVTRSRSTLARDVVVCRCEGVTCGDIQDAVAAGVTSQPGIKLWTRAGMGPCQGRSCDRVIRDLARTPSPRPALPGSLQFPAKPLPLSEVASTRFTAQEGESP